MPTPSSSPHPARPVAQAVTTAPPSQDEDRVRRVKHYLWAMGIRTICFPLAVWAFSQGWYAVAWTAAVGAAVIPSFAVLLANAVERRRTTAPAPVASPVRSLETGRASTPDHDPARAPAQAPIPGSVVSSRDTACPPVEREGEEQ